MTKWCIFFLLAAFSSFSQSVEITFPTDRMVLQRNNFNAATIYVAGNFTGLTDRIEVKLTPINGGAATNWATLQNSPTGGIFRGTLVVFGGWYKLEVRQILDEKVTATSSLGKFGVGEVFIIAGQSNAQGYQNFGNQPAGDDRVQYVSNYYNASGSTQEVPYPTFNQLQANVNIAPFGQGSWAWGVLGDLLVKRLNVPVAFINAAWEASTVDDWVESANGNVRFNVISGNIFPKGMPFYNLRNSLHQYGSITGFRSIIWHQGESDTEINTTGNTYLNSLAKLIQLSRTITGKNVTWMVCKVSRFGTKLSQPIIDAQTNVAFQVPNVFQGPNTDGINERFDRVHFSGGGLIEFANGLNGAMNNAFFGNSSPQLPSELLKTNTACETNTPQRPMRLWLPEGYRNYRINQSDGQGIEASNGQFRGSARDAAGNVLFGQEVKYSVGSFYPPAPIITATGPVSFCPGGSVVLKSNTTRNTYWVDQVVGQNKTVQNPGVYAATFVNEFGCPASSNQITVSFLPTPTNVSVSADDFNFCPNKSTVLTSSSRDNNTWSTGETTQKITVSKAGDYFVRVTNSSGCQTASPTVKVSLYPEPPAPIITTSGSNVFCEGQSTELISSAGSTYEWNNGLKTPKVTIKQTGSYSVSITDKNNCKSPTSKPFLVIAQALPSIPTVVQVGSFTLDLITDGVAGETFEWKRDGELLPAQTALIKANKTGFYSVRSFLNYPANNGKITCTSAFSEKFDFSTIFFEKNRMSVYPNPSLNGIVFVETLDDVQDAVIRLVSIKGLVLFKTEVKKMDVRQVFDFSQYPRGNYVVHIQGKNYNSYKKLLLQN